MGDAMRAIRRVRAAALPLTAGLFWLAGLTPQATKAEDLLLSDGWGLKATVKTHQGKGLDNDGYSSVGAVVGHLLDNGSGDPYDDGALSLDLRGHIENNGNLAFTSDVIYRRPLDSAGATLWGLHAGYDWREGEHGDFGWINAGVEYLSPALDLRLDGYWAPDTHGVVEKLIADQYVGNELILGELTERAAWGIEGEVGVDLQQAGLLAENPDWQLYAALRGYHFDSPLDQEAATGLRGRLQADLFDRVSLVGALGWDTRFGGQATVGVSIALWGGDAAPDRGAGAPAVRRQTAVRLFEPVERQELVVLTEGIGDRFTLTDGSGAVPFYHVDNTFDAGGAGTYEDRFQSLAEAEAGTPEGAVIILHRGDGTTSFYNSDFHLKNDQALLGAGLHGEVTLGRRNICFLGNGQRPTVENPLDGNGITLANGNLIQAINILSIDVDNVALPNAGNGIYGADVRDITIRDVLITGDGGPKGPTSDAEDAIQIDNAGGTIDIDRITVRDVRDDAVHIFGSVAGGAATVLVHDSSFDPGEEGLTMRVSQDFEMTLLFQRNLVFNTGSSGPGVASTGFFAQLSDNARLTATITDNVFRDPAIAGVGGITLLANGTDTALDLVVSRNRVENFYRQSIAVVQLGSGTSRVIIADNTVVNTLADGMILPIAIRLNNASPNGLCAEVTGNSVTQPIAVNDFSAGPLGLFASGNSVAPTTGAGVTAVPQGSCPAP